jgi:UPF0755 protein
MKVLKFFIYFIAFIVLIATGIMGGSFIWMRDMANPPPGSKDEKVFIESGLNTRQIAARLKKSNVIRSAFLFRLYIRFLAVDQRLRPGAYRFAAGSALNDIVYKLLQGRSKTVPVTIPEGMTNKQVALILQNNGICDSREFLQAASDPELIGKIFDNWKLIPAGEGLLFPDTYYFNRPTPAIQAAERMFNLTRYQIDRIFNKELPVGLDQHQACILASIVEKEAAVKDDRPLIASVFINRLKRNIKLESCATVLFAHGTHKSRLLYEDLKIDSPYNTYKTTGLPPTPISNFGASSMMAVAQPADTDYLYFVSDGNKGHRFSNSLKGHNKNKKVFFQKRRKEAQQ